MLFVRKLGSPTGLVRRKRTGSAWKLGTVTLVTADLLERSAGARDLFGGAIHLTQRVRDPRNKAETRLCGRSLLYLLASIKKRLCFLRGRVRAWEARLEVMRCQNAAQRVVRCSPKGALAKRSLMRSSVLNRPTLLMVRSEAVNQNSCENPKPINQNGQKV